MGFVLYFLFDLIFSMTKVVIDFVFIDAYIFAFYVIWTIPLFLFLFFWAIRLQCCKRYNDAYQTQSSHNGQKSTNAPKNSKNWLKTIKIHIHKSSYVNIWLQFFLFSILFAICDRVTLTITLCAIVPIYECWWKSEWRKLDV